MGKASKWIRNFLLGKKEKEKKKDSTFSAERLAILPVTPKEKRRWSFGRSSNTDSIVSFGRSTSTDSIVSFGKSSSTTDSILTSHLATKAVLEYHNDQHHATSVAVAVAVVMATHEANKAVRAAKPTLALPGPVENAAATKIQAIFRSYLARRALFALRGLVKLQALVRGHLVRKQTTATLRCMHALIAIQVRARVQRIQTAEHEPQLHNKRPTTTQSQRLLVQDNQRHRKAYTTSTGTIREISETQAYPQAGSKSRSGHVDNQFSSKHCSGRLSISKREHQLCPNPSELTDMNLSRNHNSQYGEYHSLTGSQNSSQFNSPMAKTNQQMRAPFANPLPENDHYPWALPNYMANTESSRAKVRSHSEPKQRPVTECSSTVKQRGRRSTSKSSELQLELIDVTKELDISSSHVKPANAEKNQHPWLIKLYRSTKKAIKVRECDDSPHSISTINDNTSNNCKSLTAYEVTNIGMLYSSVLIFFEVQSSPFG
ncbi:hypothetical protein CsSME_00011153 [Camellia sinensis var. sinensis]